LAIELLGEYKMIKKIIIIFNVVLLTVLFEVQVRATQKPYMLPIGTVVLLANSKPTYYLDSRFYIAINPDSKTQYSSKVLDNLKVNLATLLKSKFAEELSTSSGKNSLKKELMILFAKKLKYSEITNVYFTRFSIQPPVKPKSEKSETYPSSARDLVLAFCNATAKNNIEEMLLYAEKRSKILLEKFFDKIKKDDEARQAFSGFQKSLQCKIIETQKLPTGQTLFLLKAGESFVVDKINGKFVVLDKRLIASKEKKKLSSKTKSEISLYVKEYLKNTKKVDIQSKKFQQALFDAEEMTKLEPNKSENWLYYGTLLLYLQNVQDAQISAEVAANIAIILNPKDTIKAYMILLQSYINQFDFDSAILTITKLLNKNPILINYLPLTDTFVSIYTFDGDMENGIAYLDNLLLKHPSFYGAIVANIKLQKQELKNSLYKNDIRNNIFELQKDLVFIYKKLKHKLSPDMKHTIQFLLEAS
jgi:tetratricopeptide (TPR) repeat protein